MTRDAEAVQLLLVGLAPNYRYALFDQCKVYVSPHILIEKLLVLFKFNVLSCFVFLEVMQDQQSSSFVEALNHNYWKIPDESKYLCL